MSASCPKTPHIGHSYTTTLSRHRTAWLVANPHHSEASLTSPTLHLAHSTTHNIPMALIHDDLGEET
ncbi:hypothetical protein IF1G_10997 [Cordyceps javanica]|uniref:Uncharacterized protein n=1 Tax=Cordyceps javanica TaxID=43265 RepID=A0A545ULL9_9HYPO|nr:hypothetical protein IF1G_10997 [Cordyceps javanica]